MVNNWRIILSGDNYDAPEIRRFHLQGEATWEKDSKNRITTTSIVGTEEDGKVIVTRSGSRYYLGEPEHTGICTLEEMIAVYPWGLYPLVPLK